MMCETNVESSVNTHKQKRIENKTTEKRRASNSAFLHLFASIMVILMRNANALVHRGIPGTHIRAFSPVRTAASAALLYSTSRTALRGTATSSSLPPLGGRATMFLTEVEREKALRCKAYIDSSPEPFHCVQTTIDMLRAAGFSPLKENDLWAAKGLIQKGGKYYYTRNGSSIVAFMVGKNYKPGNGFKILGAHTDSPNLKMKPKTKRGGGGKAMKNSDGNRKSAGPPIQVNVECYGGGLWHTWFDRDLSLSGRVILRKSDGSSGNSASFVHKLVKIDRPVLRIPNLCIHLSSAKEREAFAVNKETHLVPILCDQVAKSLLYSPGSSASSTSGSPTQIEGIGEKNGENPVQTTNSDESVAENAGAVQEKEDFWVKSQEPYLLQLLADELGIATTAITADSQHKQVNAEKDPNNDGPSPSPSYEIADFELSLFDTQQASLSGVHSEYLCSARLDNLASCFVTVEALLAHVAKQDAVSNNSDSNNSDSINSDSSASAADQDVSMVALFDHEEVGSTSTVGAGSNLINEAVTRISRALAVSASSSASTHAAAIDEELRSAALSRSFIYSVDMAHAVHPNYASKHEKAHSPLMNGGLVIKSNANQRYATNGVSGFITRELARRANNRSSMLNEGNWGMIMPIQEFSVRNDCPCGSTIGPMLSAQTGIRAADVGMPQLSMHSIREMMGSRDLTLAGQFFETFFADFTSLDRTLHIDDDHE